MKKGEKKKANKVRKIEANHLKQDSPAPDQPRNVYPEVAIVSPIGGGGFYDGIPLN